MSVVTLAAVDPAARSWGSLPWLGGLLWLGLSLAAAASWMRAGAKFDQLYRAKGGRDWPTYDELFARYSREPWRWFIEVLGLSITRCGYTGKKTRTPRSKLRGAQRTVASG